jgi:hypothetical protein
MILKPDRRRRLRIEPPDRPPEPDDQVRLARPRRARLPWTVVALLGFVAGAIALQSWVGGVVGGIAILVIRESLDRWV